MENLLDLHDRVDRLILVVDGMWSLLEDAGYTDEQLREKIQEIDLADGIDDGKRTKLATQCVGCDAKVAPGLTSCQFCGTPLPGDQHDPLGGV